MTLSESLLEIKERIIKLKTGGKASSLTETETRRSLIDPLVTALGYDVDDLDQVRLGWRGGKDVPEQKEADYALFLPGQSKPSIIVEAKRLSSQLKDEKIISQTLMYAFINGVAWCLVTNGNTVAIFDAFDRKKKDRSLFEEFDIENIDTDIGISADQAAYLLNLLSPNSIKEGKIDEYIESTQASKAVFDVLQDCVRNSDKALLRLIKKKLNREYSDGQIKAALGAINVTGEKEPVEGKPKIGEEKHRTVNPDTGSGTKKRKWRTHAERVKVWKENNTIVCPVRDEGFNEVFLKENRWYAVRIREKRIPYIKYIAAYRVKPISAITHYAEVAAVVPCGQKEITRGAQTGFDCRGKYIIQFKGKPIAIKPTHVLPGTPQGTVFVSLEEILGE
ncbi:MAG: type I restriction enzyme HsdR N-terminal domain-containing protein [bacterium]|nr:type I restriction enzyme HsdR N-terminal domain-containing protein [bacterium]